MILVAGLDAEQELPILHLRLRKAARRGARIFVLHPRRTRLHDVAEHVLCAPGAEAALLDRIATAAAGDPELGDLGPSLREAGEDAIVIAGPRLADAAPGAAAGGRAGRAPRRRFGHRLAQGERPRSAAGRASRRACTRGAERRQEIEAVWGLLSIRGAGPRRRRRSSRRRRPREIDVLYLAGVDPLRDFPDADLARRALENVRFKVVQDLRLGAYEPFADVFLPAAAFLEKDGHFTDLGGPGTPRCTRSAGRQGSRVRTGRSSPDSPRRSAATWGSKRSRTSRPSSASLLAPRDVTPFDFSGRGWFA